MITTQGMMVNPNMTKNQGMMVSPNMTTNQGMVNSNMSTNQGMMVNPNMTTNQGMVNPNMSTNQGMMANPNMMTTQGMMVGMLNPNMMKSQSKTGIFNSISNEFESQLKPEIIAQGPEKVSICTKAVGFGWANHFADAVDSDVGENITGFASTYYIWLCTGGTLSSLIGFYIISIIVTMFLVSYITSYFKGFVKPISREEFESIPKCTDPITAWAKTNYKGSMCFSGADISNSKKFKVIEKCVDTVVYRDGKNRRTKCNRYENFAQEFTKKDYNGYSKDFEANKSVGFYVLNFILGIIFGSIIFTLYITWLKYTKILNSSGVGKNFLAEILT